MKNNIFKLPVENVPLTVNYYKEYLGFKLINGVPKFGQMDFALMQFSNHSLLFEKATESNIDFNISDIVLQVNFDDNKMKKLYNNYKQKVRIKKEYSVNEKGISEFSVQDCNGNIITFNGCVDYQLESRF